MEQIERLREITRLLRAPGGCDWDRAQTPDTMRPHLLEEAYEVVDAIIEGDPDSIQEELGDLLFLIFFYSRLYEEAGRFSVTDVARTVCEKLIRRHPHVFSDTRVDGVGDILENWHRIKTEEKLAKGKRADSLLDGIEETFPSFLFAYKIQSKAAKGGFDWKVSGAVFDKIREEVEELEHEVARSGDRHPPAKEVEDEFGDLLFSLVNLGRHLKIHPEVALRLATDKFSKRFRRVESFAAAENINLREATEEELDRLWTRAKDADA